MHNGKMEFILHLPILDGLHCSKFKKRIICSLSDLFPKTYFDQISPNFWPK